MTSSSSAHEYDIMISYCHHNKEISHQIWRRLLELAFKIWIDVEQIHNDVYENMYEGITRSKVVIGCVSKAYEVSDACTLEYKSVARYKKKFIPVIVEKGYKMKNVLEFLFGSMFYVDFEGGSRFEPAMTEIMRILDKLSVVPSGNPIIQPDPSSGLHNQESSAIAAQPTSTTNALSRAKSPVPVTSTFTSAREVARVASVGCWNIACVDDVIFVSTHIELIKYHWSESAGKIAITEIKRITIDGVYPVVAAASASDGVRLYLFTRMGGFGRVHRHDAATLEQRQQIDTRVLRAPGCWWHIAAWSNYLAISDGSVIALYKDDRLVRTFEYKHRVVQLEL